MFVIEVFMGEGSTFRGISEDHVVANSRAKRRASDVVVPCIQLFKRKGRRERGVDVARNEVKDENKEAYFTSSFFV